MSEVQTFTLNWDNSKLPIQPVERWKQRTCTGKKYANGSITLDNGAMFSDMAEMEYVCGLNGKYAVAFEQEVVSVE